MKKEQLSGDDLRQGLKKFQRRAYIEIFCIIAISIAYIVNAIINPAEVFDKTSHIVSFLINVFLCGWLIYSNWSFRRQLNMAIASNDTEKMETMLENCRMRNGSLLLVFLLLGMFVILFAVAFFCAE